MDGDRVGSLRQFFSPGHTPGHMAYLDVRDGSLIAGDVFTTQMGVIAAGVCKFYFPFPAFILLEPGVRGRKRKETSEPQTRAPRCRTR